METARATCPVFGHLYARYAKLVVSINNDGCADHTHKAMKMLVQLYHTASEGLQDMLKPVLRRLPVHTRLPHPEVQDTTVCVVCGSGSPPENFSAVGVQFNGPPTGYYQLPMPCWHPVCKECEAVHERDRIDPVLKSADTARRGRHPKVRDTRRVAAQQHLQDLVPDWLATSILAVKRPKS